MYKWLMDPSVIRDILILQQCELEQHYQESYVERGLDFRKFDNPLIKVIMVR